jgi:methylmalonyl-CoA/ethylmalonyl-CoA epimerase
MRLAFCFSDNVQHELIQPLDGPSIYHDFLAERPGGGLHHIGLVVPHLDPAVAQMEAAGYRVIQGGRGYGLRGDGGFAYFDTEPTLGVLLELIERPAERVAPEMVYPAPAADGD